MYSAFQIAKKYLQYYFSASNGNGHGVHSPFVFEFIKFVMNDETVYPEYEKAEAVRRQMLRDQRSIEVRDFGAGSAVIKTNTRVVSKIAASSLKAKKFAQLLYRMAAYYKPQMMIELGTSLGVTSAYLAAGNPSTTLYTLEGAPEIAKIAQQNFHALSLKNIELITGDFAVTLPQLFASIQQTGLAFVDGNHRKLPTLQYFGLLLRHSDDNTILIFDDIHWSAEMEEAWAEIKSHNAVTLTIDLFFIGIVFLRKDFKVKQHFSIRF